ADVPGGPRAGLPAHREGRHGAPRPAFEGGEERSEDSVQLAVAVHVESEPPRLAPHDATRALVHGSHARPATLPACSSTPTTSMTAPCPSRSRTWRSWRSTTVACWSTRKPAGAIPSTPLRRSSGP